MSEGRRRFLRPSKFLEELQLGLQDSAEQIEKAVAHPIVTLQREAMAWRFEIQFSVTQRDRKPAHAAFELIEQLEEQMTVYRETSEISRLNAAAFAGPIEVEGRLFRLLARCQELSRETQAAFDITAGPLIR